jgi:ribonucleoside-triphosphate reductase
MNEACLNACFLNKDLTNKEAQDFAKDVLNFMRNKLSDYQEKYGDLYNLEATPAESTAYRLASHDKKRYPAIITANSMDDVPYYTNSSQLPVGYTADIFTALDVQDELQTLYTSGTVFHTFLGERLDSWKSAANLVRKIAENYRLPYYTLSPTYSVCKDHGYLVGEVKQCPYCNKETEIYSRITGYYRPVKNWNDGKLEEYKERKTYDIANSLFKGRKFGNDVKMVEKKNANGESEILLFASKTCPNCKVAEAMLQKAGVKYTKIIAEENVELVKQYGVKQAPTLAVNGQMIVNVSNIKKYIGETCTTA